MATTVARLEAVLSANTRDFDRAMSKSEHRMGRVGKAAGVAGAAIFTGLAVVMGKSVKEAMEAEKSQARLEKAFAGVNLSLDPYKKSIEAAGKAALKLGFDDEALTDSIGSLIIATGDYKKAQDASSIAMDLARFKGIDLEQATKMLTMAMAGSQRATKQLGISVQPVTTAYDALKAKFGEHIDASEKLQLAQAKVNDKQATAALVIDTVAGKVKGQAQAYSETAAGGMEIFRVQMEELQENLGKTLLPALVKVTNALIVMLEWLQKHPQAVRALVVALGALATAMITASAAQLALNLAVLANPYVAATVAIIALAAGVALLYAKVHQLRPVIEQVALTFVGLPLPLRLLVVAFGGIEGSVKKLNAAFETLKDLLVAIKDIFQWIKDKAGGISGALSGIAGKIPGIGDADPNQWKKQFMAGTGPGSISPALYDELQGARNMGLVLTSGYRPGAVTKHGTKSDHAYYPSKAIDVSGAPKNMARFFSWLIGQKDVKQAFYDPMGSIFGGVLSSYREGGHSDHVHVATYDRGGWLRPGWNLAYNGLGRPEPVGAGTVNFNFPNYVGSKSELMSWLQNAAQQFKRQNGRSAF
jgi:hypothetical protein